MKSVRLTKLARTAALTAALLGAAAVPAAAAVGPSHSKSFWVVTKTGKVCSAGSAKHYGNGHGAIVGITGSSDGKGYWLVSKTGKSQAFGDAKKQKYRKAKLTKWSKKLGGCKSGVVGAAAAELKTTSTSGKPKSPTKTTGTTTPTGTTTSKTTTTPAPTSTTTTAGESTTPTTPASTTSTTSTPASGSTTTTGTQTTPPPATTTTTTTTTTTSTTTTTTPPPEPPTITTTTLAGGEVTVTYDQALAATGGGGDYSWSRISGQLPPGLNLSTDGTLSGTPVVAGSYVFNLEVAASDGASAEQTYSITVLAAVTATSSTLPDSEAAIAYSGASLSATAGQQPYTWAVSAGALPGGMQLSNSGSLEGTPATAGAYSFTATVTDAAGATSSQTYNLTVDAPVSISTNELPDPVQTLSYDQQLATSGGAGSDTWTVSSGTLPAGLALSTSGAVTGTATTAGGYNVTVQVTDALGGTATATYSGITATWHFNENWSGYAARGAEPYTSVSGTFNVPTLVPGITENAATSIWVGIDGADNSTLLQAGVAIGDGTNSASFAWTEKVPQQPQEQHISDFTVNPGDSMTVNIIETDPASQTWTLSIVDNTTGQSYSTSEVYTGAGETAEWIAEAPTDSQGHTVGMALWTGAIDFTDLSTSQPMTGLDYMTLSPSFVSGGAMNSLLDSSGFAVTDDEQVPAPPDGR